MSSNPTSKQKLLIDLTTPELQARLKDLPRAGKPGQGAYTDGTRRAIRKILNERGVVCDEQ